MRFDGRVAVVTGAGGGLGRSYARALSARGAQVVINDHPGSEAGSRGARELAAGIRSSGGSAVVALHDITDDAQAKALLDCAVNSFGRVDIVINNAGITATVPFGDQTVDEFRAIVDSHLIGSMAVTAAAWPHLIAQRYGRVVMTTSSMGLWGAPQSAAYCAAKAAVVGLARSLAHEGRRRNILVNCVAPAAQTPMTASRFGTRQSRTWRPDLVAPAVLYLSHDSCAITGEILSAFAGHFSRVEIVQARGHLFDPSGEVTVEAFTEQLESITAMDEARSFENGHLDALGTPVSIDLRQAPNKEGQDE